MYIRQANARFHGNVKFLVPAVPITTVTVYSSNPRFDGNVNFPIPAVPITTDFVYSTNARFDVNVNFTSSANNNHFILTICKI